MTRHLILVLGDQLGWDSPALAGFDPAQDQLLMIEADSEANQVWNHQARISLFLSGMRHFANEAHRRRWPCIYMQLDAAPQENAANTPPLPTDFAARLLHTLQQLRPNELVVLEPGEWRMEKLIEDAANQAQVPLRWVPDTHFLCSRAEFAHWAKGKKELRMEFFYREMRKRHGVLMAGKEPEGGQWNFDADNREAFGPQGPGPIPPRATFEPDAITQEVVQLVQQRFASHPGTLASFAWPVTRAQALQSLDRFIQERLPLFGRYEDALWPGEPWLYHSHLSAALNLKLLNAREVVAAAEAAYRNGHAPLQSVEGFIRQILGWREYVRGIYWTQMPSYIERNALNAEQDLPAWYWSGQTDMACLKDAITQTLDHGYAHHIQRLMVTGLYALLLGVQPRQVHEWYLAMYVDAVEWVELPNTLGMGQFGDGGLMASKPYVATGKYIQRMGGPCASCRYNPALREGDQACPFTTLYWDFLMRHETLLRQNPRMAMQLKNLARLTPEQRQAITQRTQAILAGTVGAA
jgi:deoxyribodipyrimidine photolyase-related protein